MGTLIYTRDGEGLYDHEGYVAHILDDGRSAQGAWRVEIERRTVAWRAECACGWAGPSHDAGGPNTPSDARYDDILADWEFAHARPLVAAAERVWQLDALAETLRNAERHLRQGVREATRRGATWAEIAKAIRMIETNAQRLYGTHTEMTASSTGAVVQGVELGDGPIPI